MKCVAALLVIMVCITAFLWHQDNEEALRRENSRQEQELKQAGADSKALMDAEIFRRETDTLRFTLGEEAARQYANCKTYPPATKEDQARCDKMSAELKSIQERQPK
jgi:hypothetical protein